MRMSLCTFIASDYLLQEVAPEQECPIEINIYRADHHFIV